MTRGRAPIPPFEKLYFLVRRPNSRKTIVLRIRARVGEATANSIRWNTNIENPSVSQAYILTHRLRPIDRTEYWSKWIRAKALTRQSQWINLETHKSSGPGYLVLVSPNTWECKPSKPLEISFVKWRRFFYGLGRRPLRSKSQTLLNYNSRN